MLDKDDRPGFYSKTAIILSLLLVVLTVVFAKKYFKLYSMVSRLQGEAKVSRPAQPPKKKSSKSSPRAPKAALSEILSHQRTAIRGIIKKNELIVANWNNQFGALLQKKENEYRNLLKKQKNEYDNTISDSKDQLNFLIESYTNKLAALTELVYENQLQAGELLLTLQSYEQALKTFGEALDSIDDSGLDDEKTKSITIVIHQRIATTLLAINKSAVHDEDDPQEKDSDTNLMEPALEHLEAAIKMDKDNHESYYLKAQVLQEMGEDFPAIIESLKRALSAREIPLEQILKDFDNLKDEPDFKELLPPADKSE